MYGTPGNANNYSSDVIILN